MCKKTQTNNKDILEVNVSKAAELWADDNENKGKDEERVCYFFHLDDVQQHRFVTTVEVSWMFRKTTDTKGLNKNWKDQILCDLCCSHLSWAYIKTCKLSKKERISIRFGPILPAIWPYPWRSGVFTKSTISPQTPNLKLSLLNTLIALENVRSLEQRAPSSLFLFAASFFAE